MANKNLDINSFVIDKHMINDFKDGIFDIFTKMNKDVGDEMEKISDDAMIKYKKNHDNYHSNIKNSGLQLTSELDKINDFYNRKADEIDEKYISDKKKLKYFYLKNMKNISTDFHGDIDKTEHLYKKNCINIESQLEKTKSISKKKFFHNIKKIDDTLSREILDIFDDIVLVPHVVNDDAPNIKSQIRMTNKLLSPPPSPIIVQQKEKNNAIIMENKMNKENEIIQYAKNSEKTVEGPNKKIIQHAPENYNPKIVNAPNPKIGIKQYGKSVGNNEVRMDEYMTHANRKIKNYPYRIYNRDCPNKIIKIFNDINSCKNECNNDDKCMGFSYNPKSNVCFTKHNMCDYSSSVNNGFKFFVKLQK